MGEDIVTSTWVEQRIKETRETIENRITSDREFIKSVFSIVAKICGAAFIIIVGIVGFIGYKDISSIDDKITKSVNEKIKEKSDEFSDLYKKNIQGLADQALITSYNIQFSAPQKRFERSVIAPVHIQRFLQILETESSDDKILDSLHDLLSDPSKDENSSLINQKLQQMIAAEGNFTWLRSRPERITKIIDLLTQRRIKGDPARVRAYLSNDTTAPAVRESAMRYAAMAGDQDALLYILKLLKNNKKSISKEALYSIIVLDPENEWIKQWLQTLKFRRATAPYSRELMENIALAAAVAAKAVEHNHKSDIFLRMSEDKSKIVSTASDIVKIIIDNGLHLRLQKDPFSEKESERYRLILSMEDSGGYIIPSNLITNEGEPVLTDVCIRLLEEGGAKKLQSISNLIGRQINSDSRHWDLDYNIGITLSSESQAKIDVDGKEYTVSDQIIYTLLRPGQNDDIKVNWRTNEGLVKTGNLKEINNIYSLRFRINVSQALYDRN